MNKAIEAILAGESRKKEAEAFRTVVLTNVFTSPDLALYDRRRVAQAVIDELDSIAKLGRGAKGEIPGLGEIVKARAMPMAKAAALGEMSLAEVLG